MQNSDLRDRIVYSIHKLMIDFTIHGIRFLDLALPIPYVDSENS